MSDAASRHFRLTVEYDGTDLSGWQRQANAPTVQEHLERALTTMLRHEVTVAGASRTDAGVHALGQVASFRTARNIPPHGVLSGLNSLLPDTIAVREVTEAPDDFHPRFSATGKHYTYLLWRSRQRSPRWSRWAWHRAMPLDVAAMTEAAQHLLGRHDFSAFRAVGCNAKTTVRTVRRVELGSHPGDPELLAIHVEGDAFLRNMVRIMVGTLLFVGEGRLRPAEIAGLLASGDRGGAGPTAAAHGLTLVSVRYDGRRAPSLPSEG